MNDFEEFLRKGIVKKQSPDKARSKNLMSEANRKFEQIKRVVSKIGVDNQNSNDIIEDCYDVILGLIRAKMFLKGFGSSGLGAHEAEVSFLKKLKFEEYEIEFINRLRCFRNGILYYGKRFDKEFADKVWTFLNKIYFKLVM